MPSYGFFQERSCCKTVQGLIQESTKISWHVMPVRTDICHKRAAFLHCHRISGPEHDKLHDA